MSTLCNCRGCSGPKTTKPRHDQCACGARKVRYSATCRRCVPPAKRGSQSPAWKGGRIVSGGYVKLHDPGNPRADSKGYVREHIAVVQRAIGKALPPRAVVHHVDENGLNNAPTNLVACEDQSYHELLHARWAALQACGDPAKRMCIYCKQWDDVERLVRAAQQHRHRECHAKAVREAKARKRATEDGRLTQRRPTVSVGAVATAWTER